MATPALELFLPLRAPAGSPLLQMAEGQAAVSVVGRHVGEVHVESLFVPQAEADEFTGVHSAALWYATRLSVHTACKLAVTVHACLAGRFERRGPVDIRDAYGFAVGGALTTPDTWRTK